MAAIEVDLRIGKEINFTAYRGETWQTSLPITDALDAAVDLTGSAITMKVWDGATLKADWSLDDGISVGGDDDNHIVLNKIGDLEKKKYPFEIKTVLSNAIVFILHGKMTVKDTAPNG